MKHFYLTFLLTVLMSMVGARASAHDIEVENADGVTIYYKWNSEKTELSVSCRGNLYDSYKNEYTGNVVIPSSVIYEGKEYNVASIDGLAFGSCSGLTSVTIPNSVTTIGNSAFYNCTGLKKVIVNDIAAWCNIKFGDSSSTSNPLSYAHHLYSDENTEITDLVIPNSVKAIGKSQFRGCSGLTSVAIPNSVTIIDNEAFEDCSGLTSVTIGNSVTSIGNVAFYGCSGLTSVTIPNSVTSIGRRAFCYCSGLTSVTIPNSMTSIDEYAFEYCSGLTTVTLNSNTVVSMNRDSEKGLNTVFGPQVKEYIIGDKVTSIGSNAFSNCILLTSITIPNSVTSINNDAFQNCSGLTSVIIPNSVTSIGNFAFRGCSGLTSITVESGNRFYDSRDNCNAIIRTKEASLIIGCENTVIPNSVASIGDYAFHSCSGLTSVTIPNSVTSIGNNAFSGCSGLTSVTIPNSVTSIGDYAFESCSGLTSVTIGNSVTSIGWGAFKDCSSLTSVTIPNGITSISRATFYGCTNLTSITIPSSVTNIDTNSFYGCKNTLFYTDKGTAALLCLWGCLLEGDNHIIPYETETGNRLYPPKFTVESTTQSTATIYIENLYNEYTYKCNGESFKSNEYTIGGLRPEYTGKLSPEVSLNDVIYLPKKIEYTTKSLNPYLETVARTASSITAKGTYTKGDARIVSHILQINGKTNEGEENTISVNGLEPNNSYTGKYTIRVQYGDENQYTYDYTSTTTIRTKALEMKTLQPKVVSSGNVVVTAEANVSNEEEGVGFEWRRTDWGDDFASSTGAAYVYEGTMEGYIRNLNTDKLWKYRPYYISAAGTYYYGDWVGIDPSNTSWFEPTVHTYTNVDVSGNSAVLNGYVQVGTDNIRVQGFKYWKTVSAQAAPMSASKRYAPKIPSDAKTVEGEGRVMNVDVADLDYNSTYTFVTFATTVNGETYYGEEQSFTTGEDQMGIDSPSADSNNGTKVSRRGIYTIQGVKVTDDTERLKELPQGIYIVNGKKVSVK